MKGLRRYKARRGIFCISQPVELQPYNEIRRLRLPECTSYNRAASGDLSNEIEEASEDES
jgi:hypothetical protein